MSKSIVSDIYIAKSITKAITSNDHSGVVKDIIFFGSRARGKAREDSDYDILVKLKDEEAILKWRDIECAVIDQYGEHHQIQLTFITTKRYEEYKSLPTSLPYAIEREGIVLYHNPAIPDLDYKHDDERVLGALLNNHIAVGDGRFDWSKMFFDFAEQDYITSPECAYSATRWYLQAVLAYYKIDAHKGDSISSLKSKIEDNNHVLSRKLDECGLLSIEQCTETNMESMPLDEEEAIEVLYATENIRQEVLSFLAPLNHHFSPEVPNSTYESVKDRLSFLKGLEMERQELKKGLKF